MDDNTEQRKSQNTSQNLGMTDTTATDPTQQPKAQNTSPEANTQLTNAKFINLENW